MAFAIRWSFANYSLICFVLGLLAAGVALMNARRPRTTAVVTDRLLAWYLIFAIGVQYLINFVMHGFFGRMSAADIGWADSPFQFEVATASLGFAAAGFYAAFRGFGARTTAIIGPSIFMLGAAFGHVRQMATAHNFAPGNAGSFFWMDLVIPAFGLALLILQARHARARCDLTRLATTG